MQIRVQYSSDTPLAIFYHRKYFVRVIPITLMMRNTMALRFRIESLEDIEEME
jgi:hypothetical protein